LSRITVIPVVMSRTAPDASDPVEQLLGASPILRALPAIEARSLGKRALAASDADVLLLDARNGRPSVVYRAIVRARTAGWDRGIVLLLAPSGLGMVPVASSVGASDFLVSPASPDEVEARLRRACARVDAPPRRPEAGATELEMNWRTHQISFEGTSISLTLREMQLLSVLIDHRGAVITADDLAREAWGKGRNTGGALAAAYVCSLRKKLAWFGGRFGIQTVRAVGYRFVM
jgi:DNA-binding response OmpR family regulator